MSLFETEQLLGNAVIPRRSDLLERLARANRLAWGVLFAELIAIGLLIAVIEWERAFEEPLVSVIAVLMISGQGVLPLMRRWAINKKELAQIREDKKFGEFDKYKLRSLFQETLQRLALPSREIPVFITSEKTLNASSIRLVSGLFLPYLNGIYLNRQNLHRLTAPELQDLMGHELGHYYKYKLVSERFRGVTLVLGGFVGLWVVQFLGLSHVLGYVVLVGCSSLFWALAMLPWLRHGMTIEFLCDDLGAQTHGVITSINGLLKLGAEQEVLEAVQAQQLQTVNEGNLSAAQVVESIEAAIPYGHYTRKELESAVQKMIDQRSQQARELSLKGFWNYLLDTQKQEEELDEAVESLKLSQRLPRLNWESILPDPQRIALNEQQVGQLFEMMMARPDLVLFQTSDCRGSTDGIHPPLPLRIAYLWVNRQEIEIARKANRDG